mgnify:CR=1 FL=1
MSVTDQQLIDRAKEVRAQAHCPYSGYSVGAAVLDDRGNVHLGCNVENASFPLGTCAEAGAISSMVAAGGRRIAVIVAVGGRGALEACTPCGGCRQRIAEFADDETRIVLLDADGKPVECTIAELLPDSFRFPGKE